MDMKPRACASVAFLAEISSFSVDYKRSTQKVMLTVFYREVLDSNLGGNTETGVFSGLPPLFKNTSTIILLLDVIKQCYGSVVK